MEYSICLWKFPNALKKYYGSEYRRMICIHLVVSGRKDVSNTEKKELYTQPEQGSLSEPFLSHLHLVIISTAHYKKKQE